MSDSVSVRVPFAGFYCSTHDAAMDDALELINTDDSGNSKDILCTTNVDWAAVRLDYVQGYIAKLAEVTELTMTFESIVSPKFYNFETDALYAKIPREEIEALYRKVSEDPDMIDEFRNHVFEILEPRSGFIPFYSNDLDDWGYLKDWDDVQISVLIDFHAKQMKLDENDIAADLSERCYNAIWSAVIDISKVNDGQENSEDYSI